MLSNIIQLVVVLIVFVLILVATYFTTKWVGKSGAIQSHAKNISVIETFRIATNKYIQIVKIGTGYYAIGISKDDFSFLTELSEDQLDLSGADNSAGTLSFKEVIGRLKKDKNNN